MMNTNLSGETTPILHSTDSNRAYQIDYGPKISPLTANITAIAKDNASLTKNLYAQFVSSGIPTNLLLVVTPETMASRDTDPLTTREARVVGTIIDDWGNPVSGQDITFTISDIITAPYNSTADPSFESGFTILTKTATTDSNGNAIITFYPGSFVTAGQSGYSDTATGSAVISATTSNGLSKLVTATWKNYPYISVQASVVPQSIQVNDTIDITIETVGNGYKMMYQGPTVTVLDMDVAAGMKILDQNGLTRLDNAKTATQQFVNEIMTGMIYWTHDIWKCKRSTPSPPNRTDSYYKQELTISR